jgi:hypothetical protein
MYSKLDASYSENGSDMFLLTFDVFLKLSTEILLFADIVRGASLWTVNHIEI